MHLIQVKLDSVALTLGASVGFTLYSYAAALTRNQFVFGHAINFAHTSKIREMKTCSIKKEQYDLLLLTNR
ncbi:MAG: hypothetical protein JWQ28_167 [Pedobacter sp.]|jgi:hypothetical protein|nr:hypothetical protein [Pedobacter sp.]